MNWWNERKIEWYERASAFSSYHRLLSLEIEKEIEKEERIIELGCGLGYAAEYLYNDGYTIVASDIDEHVLERAKARSHLDIFRKIDANEALPETVVYLMINFGRISENDMLEKLLSLSDKVVYIESHHSGQNTDRRKKTGKAEKTEEYLESIDALYERRIITYDFPQPFLSENDAKRYIEETYGTENVDAFMPLLERGEDYPLVLSNRKTSSIFTIRRKA